MDQFSVLSVFLFSLLSLAFVLGYDIYIKKYKASITIRISSIMMSIMAKKKRRIQNERWYQMERNKEISVLKKKPRVYVVF